MNIQLGRLHPSVRGVFAVRIDGLEQGPQNGVANVGNRPTVEGDDRFTLEVHALDFNANTYGQRVSVHFMQRIRDEKKFESFEALTTQIQKDVEKARDFFKQA
jgi:riboflavin kinase/FMN adenylyltransferase